jgi:hypothetical protein
MKITVRKVRGKDAYAVKEDGVLLKELKTKEEALKYFEDYKLAKNSKLKVVKSPELKVEEVEVSVKKKTGSKSSVK